MSALWTTEKCLKLLFFPFYQGMKVASLFPSSTPFSTLHNSPSFFPSLHARKSFSLLRSLSPSLNSLAAIYKTHETARIAYARAKPLSQQIGLNYPFGSYANESHLLRKVGLLFFLLPRKSDREWVLKANNTGVVSNCKYRRVGTRTRESLMWDTWGQVYKCLVVVLAAHTQVSMLFCLLSLYTG